MKDVELFNLIQIRVSILKLGNVHRPLASLKERTQAPLQKREVEKQEPDVVERCCQMSHS